jgi:hypothetical protein
MRFLKVLPTIPKKVPYYYGAIIQLFIALRAKAQCTFMAHWCNYSKQEDFLMIGLSGKCPVCLYPFLVNGTPI